VTKNAWQNTGLAVLTVLVLAGAVWTIVKPYPGEPWRPPRTAAAAQTPAPEPATPRPVAAFAGDSYAEGSGATSARLRWSSRVARQMGWRELNFGQGETGYVDQGEPPDTAALPQRVPAVVAADPDVVVVWTGLNDVAGGYPMPKIRAAINTTYTHLRRGLPQARIVAVAPIWPDGDPPARILRMGNLVQSAAARVDAEYVETRRWYDDLAGLRADDGLHPDDAGHRMLARRLTAALS
jgi:lysophospholipase L1-like esterase